MVEAEVVGTYPSQADLLTAEPVLDWIDENFLRPDPFAFRGASFRPVVALIRRELSVDPNGIFCVGSGAVGYSLSPKKMLPTGLKPFDEGSDLDLAIISEVHFERAWREIREAVQPTALTITPLFEDKIDWQRSRFFDGAIIASEILPALSFGPDWIAKIERVREVVARTLGMERPVKLWIYRDYWSVRNRVAVSITACRKEYRKRKRDD